MMFLWPVVSTNQIPFRSGLTRSFVFQLRVRVKVGPISLPQAAICMRVRAELWPEGVDLPEGESGIVTGGCRSTWGWERNCDRRASISVRVKAKSLPEGVYLCVGEGEVVTGWCLSAWGWGRNREPRGLSAWGWGRNRDWRVSICVWLRVEFRPKGFDQGVHKRKVGCWDIRFKWVSVWSRRCGRLVLYE